jgi:hypothetical protein
MKKWVLIGGLLLAGTPATLNAQGCSVCTKTASTLDSKAARGLNSGILYLAFLPLTILGTVGFFWWRGGRKAA